MYLPYCSKHFDNEDKFRNKSVTISIYYIRYRPNQRQHSITNALKPYDILHIALMHYIMLYTHNIDPIYYKQIDIATFKII